MMRDHEVDLREAMEILDVPEEVLGQLVEQGQIKGRHKRGTLYFDRESIDVLAKRQIEEARSDAESEPD